MKVFFNQYIINIFFAFLELLVGILLFITPMSLAKSIIVSSGFVLIVWGTIKIRNYCSTVLKVGKQINGLSAGILLILIGVFLIIRSGKVQSALDSVPTLFGVLLLLASILKIELTVGMIRLKFGNILWMTISCVFTGVGAILMLSNIYALTNINWELSGITYIVASILDIIPMVVKSKNKEKRKETSDT